MAVGRRLNRDANVQGDGAVVRRHRPDYQIILYMGLLMLLGLIIMYAIGPQRANVLNNAYGTDFYTASYFFMKQLGSVMVALLAFAAFALVPYRIVRQYAKPVLIFGFIACVILAVAGFFSVEAVAQCSLGACRWFNLGPLGTLQPAEILKFGLLVFLAGFLGVRMRKGLINDIDKTLIPFAVIAGLALFLVVIVQKDLGTGVSMMAILGSMLMVAGINKRVGTFLIIGTVILGLLLIMMAPHRRERVATFLQGDAAARTADDDNYHIKNAKIAIGTGGLFGVGIGNSVQATGYLPEAINDSVFAIMGEMFGFVGLTVILLIFAALLMRLLRTADHLSDPWMRLVAAGIFGWFGAHVVLNVASMTGVMPLTGITLPLLSFGGTSMVFIAGVLGLVFQLSRYTMHGVESKEAQYANIGSRRRVGRSRYAGRRSS